MNHTFLRIKILEVFWHHLEGEGCHKSNNIIECVTHPTTDFTPAGWDLSKHPNKIDQNWLVGV